MRWELPRLEWLARFDVLFAPNFVPPPTRSPRLVLTIHDELLFEGPLAEVEQASGLVTREMEGACELDPPLVVDVGVGENWLDAK